MNDRHVEMALRERGVVRLGFDESLALLSALRDVHQIQQDHADDTPVWMDEGDDANR